MRQPLCFRVKQKIIPFPKKMSRFFPLLVLVFGWSAPLSAQVAPPAGEEGSTAVSVDSNILINWAKECRITRGFKDIAQPDSGLVSFGDSLAAAGPALENGVVSLGDGGIALCMFDPPIKNGPGPDFAVFENSFDGQFLELAFVEVSSDGQNFVRFPATSLIDTLQQTGTFGLTDARLLHNLAGKYQLGFGVPFDLEELAERSNLNLNAIRYVKIIDVVGSLQPEYLRRDAQGRPINDPYPTPFPSGGFDLDAIGVIHQAEPTANQLQVSIPDLHVFPNPLQDNMVFLEGHAFPALIQLFDLSGQLLFQKRCPADRCRISIPDLPAGMYVLKGKMENGVFSKWIVK